jgi:protein-L-isoaspartate(D-aspartate) O-methyltransferase
LGIDNVKVAVGNGALGFPEAGPFDAIVVAAGAREVPPLLIQQLAEGGSLVIPVGGHSQQELVRMRKKHGALTREPITPCTFVPLVEERGLEIGLRGFERAGLATGSKRQPRSRRAVP